MTDHEAMLEDPADDERGLSFARQLVTNALDAALAETNPASLFEEPLAWIVEPPSETWLSSIVDLLRTHLKKHEPDFLRTEMLLIFKGAARSRLSGTKTIDQDEMAESLGIAVAKGQSVIGVAVDPERQLPRILLSGHDRWIRIGKPSTADVARALEQCLGQTVPVDLIGSPDALNIPAMAFAVRKGSSIADSVRRLNSSSGAPTASAGDDGVPELANLAGYGAAKAWGLALARDVERLRRGDPGMTLRDLPKGILLEGPPGVGKSIFALALAKTTRLPLETTSVSRWLSAGNGHLDDAIKAARTAVEAARGRQPGILMIDELDSVVDRNTQQDRYAAWWINFVNAILDLIDGTLRYPGLITIGACNNAARVDPALRRAGRLDKVVRIELPNLADREAIFRCYLGRDLPSDDLEPIAEMTDGMTGADIVRIITEARQRARDACRELGIADLAAAVAPALELDEDVVRQTAFHEAGHAVAAHALGLKVSSVQIASGNGSLGRTRYARRRRPMRMKDAEDYVTVILAGRAADDVFFGATDSGSGGDETSDLGMATAMLAGVHGSFGLGDDLTFLAPPDRIAGTLSLDFTLRMKVEADLARLQARARALVLSDQAAIKAVAERLIERRFLNGEDVTRLSRSAPNAKGGDLPVIPT